MRRTSAAVLAALALALPAHLVSSPAALASDGDLPAPAAMAEPKTAYAEAETGAAEVLEQAEEVLVGEDTRLSPTLALRDLAIALPELTGSDRRKAEGMLARPTDPDDDYGDAYTVPAKRTCSKRICVHWVPRTADAPPDRAWVDTTMKVLRKTWATQVGQLGYRAPLADKGRGGNKKFDVYLKDVGSDGYYGYCAPEPRKRGQWSVPAYCVLDDDFARAQYGTKPIKSLRVTAAHEFFHAVQFAYDYGEDRWLMEGTATWMEERVADGVNDNRQYLRHGQVAEPADPLDLFNPAGFDQYGNWAFFEYLSGKYGVGIVRKVWNHAGAHKGAPDRYSTRAVKDVLPRSTTWTELFRAYAAGNTIPARTYPEGKHWPDAAIARTHTLGPADPAAGGTLRIDHMAAKHVVLRPGEKLQERAWMLRLEVDAPRRGSQPAAMVLVHKKSGEVVRKPVGLDKAGDGALTFRFNRRSVEKATVTLVNASTRFDCWEQDTTYSCQGRPKHDDRRFGYDVTVSQRKAQR